MRNENWQTQLSEYLDGVRNTPFDFPSHNCMLFAFGAIEAVNDISLRPLYEGKLANEIAGARALRTVDDCGTVQEVLLKHLGGELQPIAFARPGDIVFIKSANEFITNLDGMKMFGPLPGVCYGSSSFFLGEDGIAEVPTLMLDEAIWVS